MDSPLREQTQALPPLQAKELGHSERRGQDGQAAEEEGSQSEETVNNLQTIAALIGAYAALMGGLYLVITRPIMARLDDIVRRLERIEAKLEDHAQRITRLEERTPPLIRR